MKLTVWIAKVLTERAEANEWDSLSYPEQRLLEAKIKTEGLPHCRCLRFIQEYLDISDIGFHLLEGQLMFLEILDEEGHLTPKGREIFTNQ